MRINRDLFRSTPAGVALASHEMWLCHDATLALRPAVSAMADGMVMGAPEYDPSDVMPSSTGLSTRHGYESGALRNGVRIRMPNLKCGGMFVRPLLYTEKTFTESRFTDYGCIDFSITGNSQTGAVQALLEVDLSVYIPQPYKAYEWSSSIDIDRVDIVNPTSTSSMSVHADGTSGDTLTATSGAGTKYTPGAILEATVGDLSGTNVQLYDKIKQRAVKEGSKIWLQASGAASDYQITDIISRIATSPDFSTASILTLVYTGLTALGTFPILNTKLIW